MTTQATEIYRHHPVIRHINDSSVKKHGAWARLIHSMVKNARRDASRWNVAAFDAAKAAGAQYLGEAKEDAAAVRTDRAYSAARRRVWELEMALALEIAGRNNDEIEDEIEACITSRRGHKSETIVARLFRSQGMDLEYRWSNHVQRVIEGMVREGRLRLGRGGARGTLYLYYVATPEVIAEEAALAKKRAQSAALRAAMKARRQEAVEALIERGFGSAEPDTYSSTKILLSVRDIEALLAMAKED